MGLPQPLSSSLLYCPLCSTFSSVPSPIFPLCSPLLLTLSSCHNLFFLLSVPLDLSFVFDPLWYIYLRKFIHLYNRINYLISNQSQQISIPHFSLYFLYTFLPPITSFLPFIRLLGDLFPSSWAPPMQQAVCLACHYILVSHFLFLFPKENRNKSTKRTGSQDSVYN